MRYYLNKKYTIIGLKELISIVRLCGEIVKKVVVKFIVGPREELIQEDPFASPIPRGTNDILMGLNSVLIDVNGLPVGQYILNLQSNKRVIKN